MDIYLIEKNAACKARRVTQHVDTEVRDRHGTEVQPTVSYFTAPTSVWAAEKSFLVSGASPF